MQLSRRVNEGRNFVFASGLPPHLSNPSFVPKSHRNSSHTNSKVQTIELIEMDPSPPAPPGIDLHALLGFSPSSARLATYLSQLRSSFASTSADAVPPPQPEVKAFPDAVYFNFYELGLSLVFLPSEGYKIKVGTAREALEDRKLRLGSVDVYNHQAQLEAPTSKTQAAPRAPSTKPSFASFPAYPIRVTHTPANSAPTAAPAVMLVAPETLGRDFTSTLGEADRKGGGEGSMGIWCEWSGVGLMVEFASGGLQAWDKGGDAVWKCATIFERGVVLGKEDGEE